MFRTQMLNSKYLRAGGPQQERHNGNIRHQDAQLLSSQREPRLSPAKRGPHSFLFTTLLRKRNPWGPRGLAASFQRAASGATSNHSHGVSPHTSAMAPGQRDGRGIQASSSFVKKSSQSRGRVPVTLAMFCSLDNYLAVSLVNGVGEQFFLGIVG